VDLYLHSQYAFMAWCSVSKKKKHRGNFTFDILSSSSAAAATAAASLLLF
jgi:hypothetical protein